MIEGLNLQSSYGNYNGLNTSNQNDYEDSLWSENINGEVEDTKQGNIGDCRLLSVLNSMRDTDWGKEAIKNSIKPDGEGGAVVKFKENGKEIEYHIPISEIDEARSKELCSTGDDDVAAFELAFLKHFGDITKNFEEDKVVKLLNGEVSEHIAMHFREYSEEYEEDFDYLINEVEKNPGKYAVMLGMHDDTENLRGHHAYQIKEIFTDENGNKMLTVVNPWDSSKTQEISLAEIKSCAMSDIFVLEPEKTGSINLNGKREKYPNILDFCEAVEENNDEKLLGMINKENILKIIRDKDDVDIAISTLDNYKFGPGKGKEKKELILPVVNALCEKAKDKNINNNLIEEVKNTCLKELDAFFYTDETAIVKALQKLHSEIINKSN